MNGGDIKIEPQLYVRISTDAQIQYIVVAKSVLLEHAGRILKQPLPLLCYSGVHQVFCFRVDVGLNYPFFKVASVAQIKSHHFNDCEEDYPSYEQSLVVSRKITELEVKQKGNVRGSRT